MTPSRTTLTRPLAVVPPPAERKRRPKPEREPERTALQLELEHLIAGVEIAERVLPPRVFATWLNVAKRHLELREQDLEAA